jgi:hypothetical protein
MLTAQLSSEFRGLLCITQPHTAIAFSIVNQGVHYYDW